MKNTIMIAFLLLVGVVSAQEIHEKRAEFYATEAVKYFNLDETQNKLFMKPN
ncbi:MAG: hypothetical protein HC798_00320 [Polaribacter sp.]|nr:hypothetical protein [Polaribacter sp.]